MANVSFEELNFISPDVHAAAAARLIELEGVRRFAAARENYELNEQDTAQSISILAGLTNYGLVDPATGILAAASVEHGYKVFARHEEPLTYIFYLVVHPNVRHRGHGHAMLKQVAQQALLHGDLELEYDANPRVDDYEFGFKQGFSLIDGSQSTMQADAFKLAV